MRNRQMTPFFHLLFMLKLFVRFISKFEKTQNSFLPFGPFWPVKYLHFWLEASNLDNSSYFFRI